MSGFGTPSASIKTNAVADGNAQQYCNFHLDHLSLLKTTPKHLCQNSLKDTFMSLFHIVALNHLCEIFYTNKAALPFILNMY